MNLFSVKDRELVAEALYNDPLTEAQLEALNELFMHVNELEKIVFMPQRALEE